MKTAGNKRSCSEPTIINATAFQKGIQRGANGNIDAWIR